MRPRSSLDCSRCCIASALAFLIAACGGITASRGRDGDVGAGPGGTRSDGPDGAKSTGGTSVLDPVPRSKASCDGLAATCGPNGNEDCCTSPLVTGGTFYQRYVAADGGFSGRSPATVSDFRLDKFEITVGRFRKFVAAYSQNMVPAGAGKNPNDANDPGWDAKWNLGLRDVNGNPQGLPADRTALATAVHTANCNPTWTANVGANENRPMECINWYEAFAFCVWDGGRLPTEAEWNYTAAGGSEQRAYPWGAAAPDCTYANYYGPVNGMTWPSDPTRRTGFCVLPGTGATNDVGSESPKGNGRWGHSDLAGNVWEWTLDDAAGAAGHRVVRGGGYRCLAEYLASLSPGSYNNEPTDYDGDPGERIYDSGVGSRCARSAP